jgi:heme/copper-type cytochrome/quinol oxidase subunit 2
MPVVVEVRTPEEFKKWVETQKAAAKQAALPAPASAAAATAPPPTAQALPN